MGIVDNALIGASGQGGGYNLTRSLRFRASASAYLNRTFPSNGNQHTWTWSCWVKRGTLGANQRLFGTSTTGTSDFALGDFYFSPSDQIGFYQYNGSTTYTNLVSTPVYRDPSAWYHIVLAYDDPQATAANRVKIYVNGVQITAFGTASYPTQNFNGFFNLAQPHAIGRYTGAGSGLYLDGYLTEVNFIDGQALTPSSFGSTNTLTGVWQPARYTGTYGTNGFYLPFTDNSALTTSSNVGLGRDYSGNGNYWTTNNISITSGVTYDSMTDVPTLTSPTAANFAVLNPLDFTTVGTVADGNLKFTQTSAFARSGRGSIGVSSGKWYWEVTNLGGFNSIGIQNAAASLGTYCGGDANGWSYFVDGNKYNSGTGTTYGASYTTNDVIGVALDLTAGTLTFYKNNTSQGVAYTGLSGTLFPGFSSSSGGGVSFAANFGQRPFTYTPPTGFVALNTFNLPDSTIVKGDTVMDATLYTGNGGTLAVANAAGFKPDLVWIKDRSIGSQHTWTDSVRGVDKQLFSSNTNGDQTSATGITSFNSNGFTTGPNPNPTGSTNSSPDAYVAWQWQAGQGTTSTNTAGTISATVSVNASAGFSIVVYTGNGTNGATVGHGLGVKPSLIIEKARSTTYNWPVQGCGVLWPTATQTLFLNTTNALNAGSGVAAPTSSVFTPAATLYANESGVSNVAYVFAPIAGYSAFGSYTGNGSSDGPMVYTGFRPKYVLVKCSSSDLSGGAHWAVQDSSRSTYNAADAILYPNLSNAEGSGEPIDLLSNGFKIRNTVARWNSSGATFIYIAFAENPFKNALAR